MTKASKAKGGMAEKLAVKKLEDEGYICEKPIRSKWQREDFFGCWDIIAIKDQSIRFVQVSTKPLYDRGVEFKQRLADFPVGTHWTKEFWQLKEEGVWRVWQI